MQKDKIIKVYTIYEEEKNGDLKNCFSVDNLDDLINWLGTNKNKNTIKSMISQHKKIDNQYLIFIDKIKESELI